jgi:hypothetical protein
VKIEKEDWIRASKHFFEFKGLPIEIALLCALNQRKNLKILARNKEVKKIKGVKIYEDKKIRKERLSGVRSIQEYQRRIRLKKIIVLLNPRKSIS